MDEKKLIKECKAKNIAAFEELYFMYEKKIYNLCYYLLKNKEDSMDALQETCLKIFRSIEHFRGESKFSTWIYRVTYNTCLDYIKKRKVNISFEEAFKKNEEASEIEKLYEEKELKYEIETCLLKLGEDFRTIIILRDINGLSYQEIAEVLDIQTGTVKSRLNRAREALKQELIKKQIIAGRCRDEA